MALENITLNIIPTGDTPSIHVAQFDADRPFNVTLKEGADDFTPTGYDIELQVRKVDNNIVTAVPVETSGNVVTFNTTEQMTACSGTNLAELQLTKGGQTFATLHFYFVVQRDVLAGGLSSQSEIYDLEEQIAAIVSEVIGDDYYTAEEVDEKIAEIPTFDPTNYYDKSDVDTLLNDKADVSDLPDMTNYYTKSEVDTKITDLYEIKTVSGSIAHFTDGGNNIPVKSLVSQIVAVESGSGTKSPDNPYTISGFDSVVVPVCGKNLIDETQFVQGSISGTGVDGVSYTRLRSPLIMVKPNTAYAFATNSALLVFEIHEYDRNGVWLQYTSINQTSGTITTTANTGYVKILIRNSSNLPLTVNELTTFQMELGTATTYEPYNSNTYTFTFGQTVYGGHFDNKGNLVVTNGFTIYDGSENWVYQAPNTFRLAIPSGAKPATVPRNCNMFTPSLSGADNTILFGSANMVITSAYFNEDVNAFKTHLASNNLKICYKLANPITLSITSQDIPTLLGENNIFSNCGDVELIYFTSKSDGLAELIRAFL